MAVRSLDEKLGKYFYVGQRCLRYTDTLNDSNLDQNYKLKVILASWIEWKGGKPQTTVPLSQQGTVKSSNFVRGQ